MKKKKILAVLLLVIAISTAIAYLLITNNSFQSLAEQESEPLTKEELTLLQKIDGEWYSSEDDLSFAITVEDENNISVNELNENRINEYRVSSLSLDKQTIGLLGKKDLEGQVSSCYIEFSDEDTIIMHLGVRSSDPNTKPKDQPNGARKPIELQRN